MGWISGYRFKSHRVWAISLVSCPSPFIGNYIAGKGDKAFFVSVDENNTVWRGYAIHRIPLNAEGNPIALGKVSYEDRTKHLVHWAIVRENTRAYPGDDRDAWRQYMALAESRIRPAPFTGQKPACRYAESFGITIGCPTDPPDTPLMLDVGIVVPAKKLSRPYGFIKASGFACLLKADRGFWAVVKSHDVHYAQHQCAFRLDKSMCVTHTAFYVS